MKTTVTFILLFFIALSVSAIDMDKNFVIFPIISYSPETSLAAGASFIHFQKPFPEQPEIANLNFGIAYFTLKKQLVTNFSTERYLISVDYKLKAEFAFIKYPNDFYGIGANTSSDMVESYTPIEVKLKSELKRRIFNEFYAGLGYRIQYSEIAKKEENGLLANDAVLGNGKALVSAVGLVVDCDRTNDNFFPSTGFKMEFSSYFYRSFLGSDFNFEKLSFEYSHFYPLFRKHVIAYQLISENTFGDVPFFTMPKFGGSEMLRGYSEGRYREKKYLAFQTELRLQVYKRFGMVIFGAMGEVAESFEDFQTDFVRFGYGFGVRYRLRKEEKLNFRIDFAFSEEDFKFYIAAREVF